MPTPAYTDHEDRMFAIENLREGARPQDVIVLLYEREADRNRDRDAASYTMGILEEACIACDLPVDKVEWRRMLEAVGYRDRFDQQVESQPTQRENLLVQALGEVLVQAGVIQPHVQLTGPELLVAAKTFTETAPIDEQRDNAAWDALARIKQFTEQPEIDSNPSWTWHDIATKHAETALAGLSPYLDPAGPSLYSSLLKAHTAIAAWETGQVGLPERTITPLFNDLRDTVRKAQQAIPQREPWTALKDIHSLATVNEVDLPREKPTWQAISLKQISLAGAALLQRNQTVDKRPHPLDSMPSTLLPGGPDPNNPEHQQIHSALHERVCLQTAFGKGTPHFQIFTPNAPFGANHIYIGSLILETPNYLVQEVAPKDDLNRFVIHEKEQVNKHQQAEINEVHAVSYALEYQNGGMSRVTRIDPQLSVENLAERYRQNGYKVSSRNTESGIYTGRFLQKADNAFVQEIEPMNVVIHRPDKFTSEAKAAVLVDGNTHTVTYSQHIPTVDSPIKQPHKTVESTKLNTIRQAYTNMGYNLVSPETESGIYSGTILLTTPEAVVQQLAKDKIAIHRTEDFSRSVAIALGSHELINSGKDCTITYSMGKPTVTPIRNRQTCDRDR